MEFKHISVLKDECIENLNINPDGIYVDGTLGRGGHSEEILKRLTTGKLIAVDKDIEAINTAQERLKEYGDKLILVHDDFKNLMDVLDGLSIDKIDGVLLDLGVSSYQIDNPERGFSYRYDAKLDMRMDQSQYLTAFNVINEYNEAQLADIFFKYGEERFSKRIARNIVEYRNKQSIRTTKQLVEIIEKSLPEKELHKGSHPAKKPPCTFRREFRCRPASHGCCGFPARPYSRAARRSAPGCRSSASAPYLNRCCAYPDYRSLPCSIGHPPGWSWYGTKCWYSPQRPRCRWQGSSFYCSDSRCSRRDLRRLPLHWSGCAVCVPR